MGKNPADQFYWQDWARDLEEHPLEIEGAWIRLCCKLWFSKERGRLSKTIIQWSRILRVDEEKTMEILAYIQVEKIGNIEGDLNENNLFRIRNNVTRNAALPKITVVCRRMYRAWKEKENNRLRQSRYRNRQRNNGDVTPPSSVFSLQSSSCLSKDKPGEPGFANHFSKKLDPEYLPKIEAEARLIEKLKQNQKYGKIKIWQVIQEAANLTMHPQAIYETLRALRGAWENDGVTTNYQGYFRSILKKKSSKYNGRDCERESRKFKDELLEAPEEIKRLIQNIG